jgi:hypothetical protein
VDKNNGKHVVIPKVEMSFKLEDDAYEMYNSYAESVGFSIRKWTTRLRLDKTIYQKHIVCSNHGQRAQHSSHETLKENATIRTCCEGRAQFSIN